MSLPGFSAERAIAPLGCVLASWPAREAEPCVANPAPLVSCWSPVGAALRHVEEGRIVSGIRTAITMPLAVTAPSTLTSTSSVTFLRPISVARA